MHGALGPGLHQVGNRHPHYQAVTLTPAPFLHPGCLGTLVPIVGKGTLKGGVQVGVGLTYLCLPTCARSAPLA